MEARAKIWNKEGVTPQSYRDDVASQQGTTDLPCKDMTNMTMARSQLPVLLVTWMT